jgi:hypothetical protein
LCNFCSTTLSHSISFVFFYIFPDFQKKPAPPAMPEGAHTEAKVALLAVRAAAAAGKALKGAVMASYRTGLGETGA